MKMFWATNYEQKIKLGTYQQYQCTHILKVPQIAS